MRAGIVIFAVAAARTLTHVAGAQQPTVEFAPPADTAIKKIALQSQELIVQRIAENLAGKLAAPETEAADEPPPR